MLVQAASPDSGWTAHLSKEGRIYYCNHVTRTASWVPPAAAWDIDGDDCLPYGWERAIDEQGRLYFINHVNKTTSYERPERCRLARPSGDEDAPETRRIQLQRSPSQGFGFVAGSERPVLVRCVTADGPSEGKLLPGDRILSVNGEDVREAPRDRVIGLVRACAETVLLEVAQPSPVGPRSTLLSAKKRALLRQRPSRVRFAEAVSVDAAPLWPHQVAPPVANVLKVFLEDGSTKSFQYDARTTVEDVSGSLAAKLCLRAGAGLFCLAVESAPDHRLSLLAPGERLARVAARPGAHRLRCLYRLAFPPVSAERLRSADAPAFDYLFTQACNDVVRGRFAPELRPELSLRLAALHVLGLGVAKRPPATVKALERDLGGLERFVPAALLQRRSCSKDLRRLLGHFLKVYSSLEPRDARLRYLDLVADLPSWGTRCFPAGPRGSRAPDRVLLVGPRLGLAQMLDDNAPTTLAALEEVEHVEVRRDDDSEEYDDSAPTTSLSVKLSDGRLVTACLEAAPATELALCLAGYSRALTGRPLPLDLEKPPLESEPPPYLAAAHRVLPEAWSYPPGRAGRPQFASFGRPPPCPGPDSNMNSLAADEAQTLDEMRRLVESSEKYLEQQQQQQQQPGQGGARPICGTLPRSFLGSSATACNGAQGDVIDLRRFPPPATPDELEDPASSAPQVPPECFADLMEADLDSFLATVVVPPPATQLTPARELTSEEIMSYIIPPPPPVEPEPPARPPKPALPPRKPPMALPPGSPALTASPRRLSAAAVATAVPVGPVVHQRAASEPVSLEARLEQAAQLESLDPDDIDVDLESAAARLIREQLNDQALQLVSRSKLLVVALSTQQRDSAGQEASACDDLVRNLAELSLESAAGPDVVLRVRDVVVAFRPLLPPARPELHSLGAQAERLAAALAALVRALNQDQ